MKNRPLFLVLGVIAIIFPVYSWICWSIVFQSHKDAPQREKQRLFLEYFPSSIHELNTITLISLTSLLLAMVFSFISARRSTGATKVISIVVFAVAGFLTVLTLLAAM